jgi:Plant transposon protein
MYPIYVHGPWNSEELNSITSLYGAAGFPGCIGPTDCVHIRWDMCPSMWFSSFKNGKCSDSSISYEMTVDHSKLFQAMTIEHYGTTSDKTIVKFDGFVEAVRFGDLYTQAEFKLQVDENLWIIEMDCTFLSTAAIINGGLCNVH